MSTDQKDPKREAMRQGLFAKSKEVWIRCGDLQPHPLIQRKFKEHFARGIRDAFNPDKFGHPVAIPRDGHYLVWEGQHRVWALRELYGDNERCPCDVIPEDTPIEVLADLFLGRAN